MSTAESTACSSPKKSHLARWLLVGFFLGLVAFFFILPPTVEIKDGSPGSWGSPQHQTARGLALILSVYAEDHHGKYPEGPSSTAVFQELIDAHYLADSSLLYFPLPGKTKAVAGQPLKPENVCWDITGGVTVNDPDDLPLVFLTGWKVAYAPGGSATPRSRVIAPLDFFYCKPRTWRQWWRGEPLDYSIPVSTKGRWALDKRIEISNSSIGSVPNFVAKTFDPKGKTYRQLTPEGVLP